MPASAPTGRPSTPSLSSYAARPAPRFIARKYLRRFWDRLPELDPGHQREDQHTDGDRKNEDREVHDSLVGFLLLLWREPIPASGAAIYLSVWVFSAVRGLRFAYFICQRFLRHGANSDHLPSRENGAIRHYGGYEKGKECAPTPPFLP